MGDTKSMSEPDFPSFMSFFFLFFSQGEWNCQGVSAPQGKDYFIMNPRTCWSFAGAIAKWRQAKRGKVSRGAWSVGNAGGERNQDVSSYKCIA